MSDNRWADLLDEQYLGMIERIAEAEERQVELLEQLVEQTCDTGGDPEPEPETEDDPRHQLMGEFGLSERQAETALELADEFDEPQYRSDMSMVDQPYALAEELDITYGRATDIHHYLFENGFLAEVHQSPGRDVYDADPDKEHLDEMARLFGVTPIEGRAALRMIRKFDPPMSKAEADRHRRLLDKTLDIPTPTLASIYSYCQYHRLLGQSTSDTDTDPGTDPGGGA